MPHTRYAPIWTSDSGHEFLCLLGKLFIATCFEMAEKVVQKLEEQLNCSICLDTYTNPKLLQCFHVYCKECLVRLVARDQRGQLSLTCPNCRQATPIPDTGVSGLQSAFHIYHLLEIVEEHKKEKDTTIAETTEESVATGVALQQQSFHCSEHVDEELKLYCETCSEVICYKCISTKWGKHHSHDYESIGEAFEKFKEEILSAFLVPMGSQLTRIGQALTGLETCSAGVTVQQDLVEANIEGTVKDLQQKFHEMLEARKRELLNRLDEISQGKLKSLTAQKDRLETTQAQLHSCEGFVRQSIKTECQSEVLKMRKAIIYQAKELMTEYPAFFLKPCTEPDMIFSASGGVSVVVEQFGGISSMSMVDPAKCHATGRGLETAIVGEKSTATVQAVSGNGSPCLEPIESLECELESILTGARVRGGVKEVEHIQYEMSYQPVTKGRNLLHIRVGGLNIRGSPFDVEVVSPFRYSGVPIQTFGFVNPWGVAFNHVGEIVVSAGYCVSVLNGTRIRSFGTAGSRLGQFLYPMCVAVDDDGNILVADSGNHRIQKFTNDGQFLASVGTKGTGPLQFDCPMDIAFNTRNKKVCVVENWNHRIQLLNSNLTFSSIIGGGHSSKNGEFAHPWGVTCDSTGNVYVADYGNHRIQVFTASMKFLRKFGCYGQGEGELIFPMSVAVDSKGMVFISDSGNYRISVFTSKGRFVKSFGQHGSGPGEFDRPRYLAVDDCGVLCVCDNSNNRVQIF